MIKRLVAAALLVVLSGCTTPSQRAETPLTAEPSSPPHIVLFFADDLSLRDVGPYGARVTQTPTLDRMARDGMVFDYAFVVSPACAPSRSALFTGMMPERNGVTANHDYSRNEGVTSLIHRFTAAGYDVAMFGKVAHWITNPKEQWDHGVPHIGKHGLDVSEVEAFLTERDSARPLLLMVGTRHPHVPWIRHDYRFSPEEVDLAPRSIDTPQTRINRAQYYESISRMDRHLAQTLDLASSHLGDREKLYLFTSDHGAQWPFAKWNLYDESMRVPLLAVWPEKIPAASRTSAMVTWLDLLPTMLDFAGGTIDDGRDGRSFAPVLLGEADRFRDVVIGTHTGDGGENVFPMRSARTERFLYIRNLYPEFAYSTHIDKAGDKWTNEFWRTWVEAAQTDAAAAMVIQQYRRRPAEEFFDLEADPFQQENLIGSGKFPAEIARLRAAVDAYMRDTGDQGEIAAEPTMPDDLPAAERGLPGLLGPASSR